jgi:hypothetical protein
LTVFSVVENVTKYHICTPWLQSAECGVGDDPIFWTFFQVVFIVYLPQI